MACSSISICLYLFYILDHPQKFGPVSPKRKSCLSFAVLRWDIRLWLTGRCKAKDFSVLPGSGSCISNNVNLLWCNYGRWSVFGLLVTTLKTLCTFNDLQIAVAFLHEMFSSPFCSFNFGPTGFYVRAMSSLPLGLLDVHLFSSIVRQGEQHVAAKMMFHICTRKDWLWNAQGRGCLCNLWMDCNHCCKV